MRKPILPFLLLFFLFSFTQDRDNFPQDYFRSPVSTPLRLSGTFGELRPNHFHYGIDIKGAVGDPLFAAADGYVKRITVQAGGYGKVLYLSHPNGYTTVYAHMDRFADGIEAHVKRRQYEFEQFEVDLVLEAHEFPVLKGDQIGNIGLTGRSFGPHLHFEVRDSKTDTPINPLLFNFNVPDDRAPRLQQLKIYQLSAAGHTVDANTTDLLARGNSYSVRGDTIHVEGAHTGLALRNYDPMTGVHNKNGIYALELLVEDSLLYSFSMDKLSFKEMLYSNAHLDYEEQVLRQHYFHRAFLLPANRLSIYKTAINQGIIKLAKGQSCDVRLLVQDFEGNQSELAFVLKRGNASVKQEPLGYTYQLVPEQEHLLRTDALEVYFPEGAFYETLYLRYDTTQEHSSGVYSAVHQIHDYKTPVHKRFHLSILPEFLPDSLASKAFIAYCGKGDEIVNCGGSWEGAFLKTRVRHLGDYSVMVDQIPPTITPISFRYDMRWRNQMSFTIMDNFPSSGQARDLDYYATIDGEWILMEFDAKTNILTHHFEDSLARGEHRLILVVEDSLGNQSVIDEVFNR